MNEYVKAGRHATRYMFYIIMAISVANVTHDLIIVQNEYGFFLGNLIPYAITISWISRFFIGGYIELSKNIDSEPSRLKLILDSLFLYFTAIILHAASVVTFTNLELLYFILILLCIGDSAWILLVSLKVKMLQPMQKKWIWFNYSYIIVGFIVIYYNKYDVEFNVVNVLVLLAVSSLLLVLDLGVNFNEYFSGGTKSSVRRIYVAGPYGDKSLDEVKAENTERAREVAKLLALKGHIPFIPHTMLYGWEKDERFSGKNFIFNAIGAEWLKHCDAIFVIDRSPGTDNELKLAVQRGIQVYFDLDQVPQLSDDAN